MSSLGINVPDEVRSQGPSEDLDYTFDFSAEMAADGVTIPDINSVTVTTTKIKGDGTDFSAYSPVVDPTTNQKVQVWCKLGAIGDAYDITVVAATGASSQVYQRTLRLSIVRV